MSLKVNSGVVTIQQANSAVVSFQPPSGGSCTAPNVGPGTAGTYCALPAVTANLTYNSANSTYTFVTHPYHSYAFNSSGQLISEAGPGGATLTVSYNTPAPGSGRCAAGASSCTTVSAASGRSLVLALDGSNRITTVTDPLNRSWSYAYCAPPSSTCSTGDLVSVTDPRGKVTSFTYDQGNGTTALKHDLLTRTSPNGQPGGANAGAKLVNSYDSSGRVSTQTDPAGNQTSFDYSNLDTPTLTGATITTDPDGNQTDYVYNAGILVSRTSGYLSSSPSTVSYQPDQTTLLTDAVVDPNGNETDYGYNAVGDLISTTNPLGETSTSSYNSFDELTCATAPLAASGCASLSPPAAITAGTSTITPPSSAPPKYATYAEYDTAGNPIWTTIGDYNPGSSTASQSRTSYHLYAGQSVTIGSTNDSCTTAPPATSLPCLTINPDAVVTQLHYDASSGDLLSTSTPDGNPGGELAATTYGYDADGELTTTTAPNGNLTGANAATFTTTNTYNSGGQVSSQTVSHTAGAITARTTSYGYDDNGNRTSLTDPRNKTTNYTYTANDQLTLTTDPDAQQTLTCYDGDGNRTQTVPPVGVAANSLTAASCPTSYPSSYGSRLATDATTSSYDALGNATAITTPAPAGLTGHETTTNSYDPAGQLLSVSAPPASNTGGAPNQVTAYTYDTAGELLTKTAGSGTAAASTTSYCYDPNGAKTATVAADGNSTTLTTCATSAPYQTGSAYQTGYSYDSLGELASTTRPATTWASSGQTTTNTYDPAGNLTTSQDPKGITTTNTYTPLNQLAATSYSGSSAPSASYSYDANGNRLTMSDGTGSSSYGYDPFNELSSYQNGASKTVSYGYDDNGDISGITYPLGSPAWATTSTVAYGYDNASELNSVTDFNGHTISVGNTADGLPNSLALGATGDTVATTYDPTDTPSQITLGNGSTLLGMSYSDVPSGAISSETDTPSWTGSPAAYTYDPQNRVTQMTPGAGSALNYAFDASGNLTTLPTGATGSYDNASELTSNVLAGTTTNYTYDADGQRTQAARGATTISSGSYNGAQELTAYSNAAANMTAASYDGDGLRASTTTGGTTQNYVWDVNGSLSRLLMDATNAYLYGPNNTPIEQVNLSSGTITYLVADQLGSVRGTVNSAGTLTASTGYDAWGNPETTGGLSATTPFGYAGGYTDATGLSYLIGRYYDPQTGQFISLDPLVDQTEQPYAYTDGDPVTGTDSNGLGIPLDWGDPSSIFTSSGGSNGAHPGSPVWGGGQLNGYPSLQSAWDSGALGTAKCPTSPYGDLSGPQGWAYWQPLIELGTVFVPGDFELTGAAEEGLSWAEESGILRAAARGKGNFGVGSATSQEADVLGRAWVGENYTIASDGRTLVSKSGLRQFRPPSYKPNLGGYQANFEQRFEGQLTRGWQSNGHLDVTNLP